MDSLKALDPEWPIREADIAASQIVAAQIDHCAPYRWAQIPVLMGLRCKLMPT